MGTEYHISWVSELSSERKLEAERISVQSDMDSLLAAINKSMSTYDTESELSLINKSLNTDWQSISYDLYTVLDMAMEVNRNSSGAFDITVGPLVNLWGFGPTKQLDQRPVQDDIDQQLLKIGSSAIKLRHSDDLYELKLTESRYIDLSAIAKGYAVDVLANHLEELGIVNYLVEVGGEISAGGKKSNDKPWRIAIETPSDNERLAQLVIPLSNEGIATSGDYRNFFTQDDHRFSHTIDGRTGYPVDHDLASVSVIHKSVAMADAWATALTVLGVEEGLKVAEKYELSAYFIQRSTKDSRLDKKSVTVFETNASSEFKKLELTVK